MDRHPEQPSWWTQAQADADSSTLAAREDEFEEPVSPEDLATNEAIRRALGSQAFIDKADRRGGIILRRQADGSIEEIPGSDEDNPPTEDNQGEQ